MSVFSASALIHNTLMEAAAIRNNMDATLLLTYSISSKQLFHQILSQFNICQLIC